MKKLFFLPLLCLVLACSDENTQNKGQLSQVENDKIREYIYLRSQKKQIIDIKNTFGNNLKGIKLIGVNLSGADLSGIDFSGAEIARVDFSGCNLNGVNFQGATIQESDFSGVVFSNFTAA